ncbi:hypothetical protein HanIR_Chr02g0084471 [Helianthus annuus]|nr:hypothetical protein HanIR_Chr02g0084471 [Helianthus annuus]
MSLSPAMTCILSLDLASISSSPATKQHQQTNLVSSSSMNNQQQPSSSSEFRRSTSLSPVTIPINGNLSTKHLSRRNKEADETGYSGVSSQQAIRRFSFVVGGVHRVSFIGSGYEETLVL